MDGFWIFVFNYRILHLIFTRLKLSVLRACQLACSCGTAVWLCVIRLKNGLRRPQETITR
jgi:hypothetical protein